MDPVVLPLPVAPVAEQELPAGIESRGLQGIAFATREFPAMLPSDHGLPVAGHHGLPRVVLAGCRTAQLDTCGVPDGIACSSSKNPVTMNR